MYSWEITELTQKYKNTLPSDVYINICRTSPQIDHIKYEPYGEQYDMWDKDGNHWNFKVENKNRI